MSDLIDNGWSSDCHKAPVRVVGGMEGTNHWECTKCGQSCNATNPGIYLAAPEPLATTDTANPPKAIEDKLNKLWDIALYRYEPAIRKEAIQAIITTETTNAVQTELGRLYDRTPPENAMSDVIADRMAALHKEQNK